VTVVVTVTADEDATPSSVVKASPTVEAPEEKVTAPPGQSAEVVTLPNGETITRFVTVLVTVTADAEPSPTTVAPIAGMQAPPGQSAQVVTLSNGEVSTRFVTVVVTVTQDAEPAPTPVSGNYGHGYA
jgi:hypothetical protein